MEGLAWLASATAFAVSMSATSGPNNAMVTASGTTWGFRRTLPHMLGVAVGFPAMPVAVALGAGEVLRARPWLHEALRWAGAAYLLCLAWKIAAADPEPPGGAARGPGRGGGSRPLSFAQAALFQWVNPKRSAPWPRTPRPPRAPASSRRRPCSPWCSCSSRCPPWRSGPWWGVGAARVLRTRRALRAFNLAMAALLVLPLAPMVLGR